MLDRHQLAIRHSAALGAMLHSNLLLQGVSIALWLLAVSLPCASGMQLMHLMHCTTGEPCIPSANVRQSRCLAEGVGVSGLPTRGALLSPAARYLHRTIAACIRRLLLHHADSRAQQDPLCWHAAAACLHAQSEHATSLCRVCLCDTVHISVQTWGGS